ncbi:MAG: SGNH/GDSL hydrolase family protein, partial [Opitutales bacterium]
MGDAGPTAPEPASAPRTLARLAAGQPIRIVCFGDSITGVYYHTGGRRAWGDVLGYCLQQEFPSARLELVNAGISGHTTVDALGRLESDVLRATPDLVVVMFGMNDVVRVPADDFHRNLSQIAQRIREHGAEVILMTPNFIDPSDTLRPLDRIEAFMDIVRTVGRELRIPVADTFRDFRSIHDADRWAWTRMLSDAVHPNLRGHVRFAELAASALVGRPVHLRALPVLRPRLPCGMARLQAGQPLRIVAMPPFDAWIGPALQALYPGTRVDVTPWVVAGKSVGEIEEQAKSIGWAKYRDQPGLPPPDLVLIAVPAGAPADSAEQFYRSYAWVLN